MLGPNQWKFTKWCFPYGFRNIIEHKENKGWWKDSCCCILFIIKIYNNMGFNFMIIILENRGRVTNSNGKYNEN